MATSRQTIIPVVRLRTKTVLGALNTGGFIDFIGNETSFTLPSGQEVEIAPFYPDNTRTDKKPWYMAYLVDDDNYRLETYLQFTDFETVNSFNTKVIFQSPATMPNIATPVANTLQNVIAGPRLDDENVAPGLAEATPNPVTGLAFSQNVAVNATLTSVSAGATPSAVNVTTGTLPTGLSLSIVGQDIKITGTPTVAAAISFTITIDTEDGDLVVPVSGTVAAAASSAPNPVSGVARVAGLSATTLLTTVSNGTPSGATVTTGSLPAGLSLAVAGQAVNLTGTASAAGAISFSMTIATSNGSIVVPVAGTIAAAPTGSPNPVTGLVRTVNFNQTSVLSTISGGTPTGVSATTGTVPAGCTLDFSGQTIRLTGTPSAAAAISFTATVVTANGNVVVPVSGTVNAAPVAAPTSVTGLGRTVGFAQSSTLATISGTGATVSSVSATTGTVPAGCTLGFSGQNITLSGTPSVAGAISFTATVVTPVGNAVFTVAGTVAAAPVAAPNPVTGLTLTEGEVTNADIATVSGATPSSVSATTGTVPAGTSLSIVGQGVRLTGTPTTPAAISFTATVVTPVGNIVIPVSGTVEAAAGATATFVFTSGEFVDTSAPPNTQTFSGFSNGDGGLDFGDVTSGGTDLNAAYRNVVTDGDDAVIADTFNIVVKAAGRTFTTGTFQINAGAPVNVTPAFLAGGGFLGPDDVYYVNGTTVEFTPADGDTVTVVFAE